MRSTRSASLMVSVTSALAATDQGWIMGIAIELQI